MHLFCCKKDKKDEEPENMFIPKENKTPSNTISIDQDSTPIHDVVSTFRFRVLKCPYTISNNRGPELFRHYFIALVHTPTDLPIWITPYTLQMLQSSEIMQWTTHEADIYAVCNMLNYILIDNREKYQINDIQEINLSMLKDFIRYTCSCRDNNGNYLAKQTVIKKRNAVSIFLWRLCTSDNFTMLHLKANDLLTFMVKKTTDHKNITAIDYKLSIIVNDHETGLKKLYRDMPLSMAQRWIRCAQAYDPTLTFAIALSLFAGLREGEVCSLRQKESPYGPSIYITQQNGICTAMKIRFRDNYMLRADAIFTGSPKKRRDRPVCAQFLLQLWELYQQHMKIIAGYPLEQSQPLFFNTQIDIASHSYKAMTVSSYRYRVDRLLRKYLLPELRNDPDPEIQIFCRELDLCNWAAHGFRHWFSVALVLMGYDKNAIKSFRGDTSYTGIEPYLQDKSLLIAKYHESAEKLGIMIQPNVPEVDN